MSCYGQLSLALYKNLITRVFIRKMKFYFLVALYFFVFFGSIYGLFADQISLKFGSNPKYHLILIGWQKNLICSLGLLATALASTYPMLLAVYNALSKSNS